jgi:hypothetical protein
VLSVSSWGPQGGRQARRSGAELTRSLGTAAFVGGERALVSSDDGGAALQCQCRRGKVRAASIGDNGGGWEGLTVKRRRRWCSDGNRRGGGVSGGGSRRGGCVGSGEGKEELELGRGREENDEERERVVAGGISKASVARGSGGKRSGALQARPRGNGEGGEGARAWRSVAWDSQQRPPTIGHGRRCCHATGESGGARTMQCERG